MARHAAAVALLAGLACSAAQQNVLMADVPVAGSAGGWLDSSPASAALESMLGDETCTIERRTVESLADDEFQRDYFNKKAVLLRYASSADAAPPPAPSGFEESWPAVEVEAWLVGQGMDTLAAAAFDEEVDGLMALEMDASDWASLGADAAQVAKIAASLAGSRQPLWSREGLKQHCGAWDASIPTVRAIIASDGDPKVKFQPLSEYLDYLRDSELKGIVRGGMDNITDPIKQREANDAKTDVNYYFFGSPLFDGCQAAAAGVPSTVQNVIDLASGDNEVMKQDFIDNPQFVLGESGSGFPFHQHGEAILQLMTGRKRWWLLDAEKTPPSGYRHDMSQLKWVQQMLGKLPESVKPWTCTQEPGEILYVPDGFWHATLNIGETLAIGAQAGQTAWAQIHKDRGALLTEVYTAKANGVTEKQVKKLTVKIDKMLKKYGPNSHLLDAKAGMLANLGGSDDQDSPTDRAFQAAVAADPLSEATLEKYAMWLSQQSGRFHDAMAVWHQIVQLEPLRADGYLYWASMMLMPSSPTTGGYNLSPSGLKTVADTLLKAAARVVAVHDPWAAGTVVDIESEDGWERGTTILGPSESGEGSELRVRFQDGVVNDWSIADFRTLWKPGDAIDIDTEDGLERGAKVLGPSGSGSVAELSVEFKDGTVDDWEVTDFRAPQPPTDFSMGSKQAVVQHICNAGAYVYAVAGVKGGKNFIDTCKVGFKVGLTMTAADLKLPTSEKASNGRKEMKLSLQALRASDNPAFATANLEKEGIKATDDALGKAILTGSGARKIIKLIGEREFPVAYMRAAAEGKKLTPKDDFAESGGGGGWFGGGGAQLSAHDDKGGWGGGCSVAADAVTAEVGCDFDRRLVSTDGGKDGGLTPKQFIKEYVSTAKPVILRTKDPQGLLGGWGAAETWTRNGLIDKYGKIDVNISSSSAIVKLRQGGDNNAGEVERSIQLANFGSFIEHVMGRAADDPSVLADRDPPYLFRARQLPKLEEDYRHLPFFDDVNTFHHDMGTRERIALFFVGPGQSGAYFHQHMNAYNALIYGAKRWFVLPPQATHGPEQPSMLDWLENNLPTLKTPPLQCVQHAGEVAYVPSGWHHGILNLCDAVGVALEVGLERAVLLGS